MPEPILWCHGAFRLNDDEIVELEPSFEHLPPSLKRCFPVALRKTASYTCVCAAPTQRGEKPCPRELVSLRERSACGGPESRQVDVPGPEEVSSGNVWIYDMGGDTFFFSSAESEEESGQATENKNPLARTVPHRAQCSQMESLHRLLRLLVHPGGNSRTSEQLHNRATPATGGARRHALGPRSREAIHVLLLRPNI